MRVRWRLWRTLLLPEWRHHPWRQAAALVAIALGVALAYSVHLINLSALAEFDQAVRAVNGQPDLSLRAVGSAGFDEALYARAAALPGVAVASPQLEIDTSAVNARGEPVALRVLGIDGFVAPAIAPGLVMRAHEGAARTALIDPDAVFLNPAARRRLNIDEGASGTATLHLRAGSRLVALQVRGDIAAEGTPLAVMDLAGAQATFGRIGRLTRIDLRLAPGTDANALLRTLALPADVRSGRADEASQRISNLSRAYRVNLTVLALVALFTGAFLVFTVQALAIAQRVPQVALLGVLGLGARERFAWVLGESAVLGVAGSGLGLLLGAGMAALALRWLGGDLGGGVFGGAQAPALQVDALGSAVYGALGVVAALLGGWVPARAAQQLAPAQGLKGLAVQADGPGTRWVSRAALALVVAALALALVPPFGDLPLAAYASVACLLLGGIAGVPWLIGLGLRVAGPRPMQPVLLLAVRRALDQRHHATAAVAGVVASLSLAVALTAMVASFRGSVTAWLDQVLPADLYLRSATTSGAAENAWLAPEFIAAAARAPGVQRVQAQRVLPLVLDSARPAVSLLARSVGADPAATLPLVGPLRPPREGLAAVYVSETFAALYDVQPGSTLALPLPDGRRVDVFVRALWRDYARQQGSLAIDSADWQRLSGDTRVNDLAVWLAPGAQAAAVSGALRQLAGEDGLVDIASAAEIRAISLTIFDRSFAVTQWLQAVAIAIGLAGIATSFSAQVLARRKEFGMLRHLGMTRAQVLALVAGEGLAWTACGALLGVVLGLAVSVVLVDVVNPQSFHWTMDLAVPWARIAVLAAAVLGAGTLTAWLAGRSAAGHELALAVKEDW